jgi:hypothetical protein
VKITHVTCFSESCLPLNRSFPPGFAGKKDTWPRRYKFVQQFYTFQLLDGPNFILLNLMLDHT